MIFKIILQQFKAAIAQSFHLASLRKAYPTCRFYSGAVVDDESVLGRYNVIFANVSINHSTIGDHTFVQKNSVVNYADIGMFCSIAEGVTVGLGRHPLNYVSTHPSFYSATQPLAKRFADQDTFMPFTRTKIGHDVWIGQKVMVVDGVIIGTGAVLAAGSVITKDVPEYAIVGGIPARIIRYRFDENTIKELLRAKWWEMPDELKIGFCKYFSSAEAFITLGLKRANLHKDN